MSTSKDWEMNKYSFALPDFRRGELNGALWHLPGSGEGETREAPREQNFKEAPLSGSHKPRVPEVYGRGFKEMSVSMIVYFFWSRAGTE